MDRGNEMKELGKFSRCNLINNGKWRQRGRDTERRRREDRHTNTRGTITRTMRKTTKLLLLKKSPFSFIIVI